MFRVKQSPTAATGQLRQLGPVRFVSGRAHMKEIALAGKGQPGWPVLPQGLQLPLTKVKSVGQYWPATCTCVFHTALLLPDAEDSQYALDTYACDLSENWHNPLKESVWSENPGGAYSFPVPAP